MHPEFQKILRYSYKFSRLQHPTPERVILRMSFRFAITSGNVEGLLGKKHCAMREWALIAEAQSEETARLWQASRADPLRPFIPHRMAGEAEHCSGISLDRLPLPLQSLRETHVVCILPRDPVGAGLSDAEIQCLYDAFVREAMNLEPFIAVGAEDLRGSVIAPIIDHDELEVGESLPEDALYGGPEEFLTVPDRYDDGDKRFHETKSGGALL